MNFLNPLDIRKGEGRKALLMFLYFFITITVLYVLKPVRSSLFLEELGSQKLRYVYLGEGLFLILVTWLYVQLAKKVQRKTFFTGILMVFITNLLLFWWLFRIKVAYLSAFFYIWVACFSIVSVTQFWTLANDIFNPQEAKRLFGLIISGGSAGGVIGGILTNRAVKWIHTEDLLLLSSLLLTSCIVLVGFLWQYLPEGAPGSGKERAPIETQSTRKLFLTSKYLWMLAGVVMFAKVASTVVDNQFNAIVELNLVGKQAKTAFFGAFSAGLNVISFLMQIYATSVSLRLLGIGISLALLPIGLTSASLFTVLVPALGTATFLKIFDGSINYSVQQASKEVLYLPLSSSVRYRAKPVIDMLIYRVSKSLGGLLIIIFATLFSIPNDRTGILIFFLVPFWLYLVWKMKSAYLHLLRERLWTDKGKGSISKPRRATEMLSFLYDEKTMGELRTFLKEESTLARKMAATACLIYHRAGKDLEATRRLVNEMIRWEALEAPSKGFTENDAGHEREFLDELLLRQAEKEVSNQSPAMTDEDSEAVFSRLSVLLKDPKQAMNLKHSACEFMVHQAHQKTADLLLKVLSETQGHALRFLLIQTLLRVRDRNASIRWNRPLVKKEIFREAELYLKIRQLSKFYQDSLVKKEEFLEVALEALSDESLERLFRCFGLLYPGEAMQIIYERLLEHPQPDAIRSHALELLHNLVGPEFYGLLEKLFDQKISQKISEEEAVSLLEEMLGSGDRWLSLMARFVVGEMGLKGRWPKLGASVSDYLKFESLDV